MKRTSTTRTRRNPDPGWWLGRAADRGRIAAVRLHAAHRRFDLSMIVLRKAALDHVDCQHLVSTALQATLDRLVQRDTGPVPREPGCLSPVSLRRNARTFPS